MVPTRTGTRRTVPTEITPGQVMRVRNAAPAVSTRLGASPAHSRACRCSLFAAPGCRAHFDPWSRSALALPVEVSRLLCPRARPAWLIFAPRVGELPSKVEPITHPRALLSASSPPPHPRPRSPPELCSFPAAAPQIFMLSRSLFAVMSSFALRACSFLRCFLSSSSFCVSCTWAAAVSPSSSSDCASTSIFIAESTASFAVSFLIMLCSSVAVCEAGAIGTACAMRRPRCRCYSLPETTRRRVSLSWWAAARLTLSCMSATSICVPAVGVRVA